jgi:hypothetical protein
MTAGNAWTLAPRSHRTFLQEMSLLPRQTGQPNQPKAVAA